MKEYFNCEFDAPHYFDFSAEPTYSTHTQWFEEREGDETDEDEVAGTSGRAPLLEVQNQPKQTNIRTSWGAKNCKEESKKRKAKGTAGEPTAKVAKPPADAERQPDRKARPQKARPISKQEPRARAPKELRVKNIIKKAKKTKVQSLGPRQTGPARSTKQLTIPQEPEFRTSKRAEAHKKAAPVQVEDNDGASEDDSDASPYKPLVQRLKEVSKTPGRYKKQPDEPPPQRPLEITVPKEPALKTSRRARPSVFKPLEEVEAELMANMPVFKASKLNPSILTDVVGIPHMEKKERTEQRPFHFVTDDRAEARAARLQQQQQQEEAEAGPSKPRVRASSEERDDRPAEMALPAKARKSMAVTDARSPFLRTKARARPSKIEEPRHEFHARPVPKFISVPSLDLSGINLESSHAPTQPKPFKLATEQRGAQYQQALAVKRDAEEQAARHARIPRAQGLPLSTDMPMVPPKPEPRKLTIPEPFGLASEARHNLFEEQRRKEREAEEAAKRNAAAFKARPMWRGIPFRLYDAEIPLTVPEEVPLHTSARVAEREAFSKLMEQKQKQAELAAQRAAEAARLAEEEERKQLRSMAQFKARPMPDLSVAQAAKPVPAKPITKPVSPRLGRPKRRVSS